MKDQGEDCPHNNTHLLSQHFNEVIRRHHVLLANKNLQIEELQEVVAQWAQAFQKTAVFLEKNYRKSFTVSNPKIHVRSENQIMPPLENARRKIIQYAVEKNRRSSNKELPFTNTERFRNTIFPLTGSVRGTRHKPVPALINNAVHSECVGRTNEIFSDEDNFGISDQSSTTWSSDYGNFGRTQLTQSDSNSSNTQLPAIDKITFDKPDHQFNEKQTTFHTDNRRRIKEDVNFFKKPMKKQICTQNKIRVAPITNNEKVCIN